MKDDEEKLEKEKKELERKLAEERKQIECEVYGTLPEDSDEDIEFYWEEEIERRLKLKSAYRIDENNSNAKYNEIIVID